MTLMTLMTLMTVMTLTLMTLMTLMTLTWMTLINLMTLKTLMTLMTLMILVILITLMTLMTLMTLLTLSHWPQRPGYSSQRQLRSGLVLLVRWSVSLLFFRKTAHRIFPIFCMNVPYYKGKKRTRRFSREKSGSFKNSRC